MTLIVQTCSGSKQDIDGYIPALDLYTGYFYKIINKTIREDALAEGIQLCILSAEHGIIDPTHEVEWYDRRMTPNRAKQLREDVCHSIEKRVNDHNSIVVNAGVDYLPAVEGLSERVDIPVYKITGSGIGDKGSTLKKLLREGDAVIDTEKIQQL